MLRSSVFVFALCIASAPATPARAARLLAAFVDDAGDVFYEKPGDSDLVEGDFDLRRFEVWLDGKDVVLKVTLSSAFRRPQVTARETITPVPMNNALYLQNIDIYVDTDGAAGAGSTDCIPGRRVGFAGGRGWEAAVVLAPQPGPVRTAVESMGPAAKRVIVAERLHASGRTVTARVPAAALGGIPQPSWGWSVHVSGARWERSFTVVDRIADGGVPADALTMPVHSIGEAWAFGGAPAGEAHPRVVDVLLPRGADQKSVLGSSDAKTGAFARVPFVSLEPAPPAPAPPPAPVTPTVTVVDIEGTSVTLAGDIAGIAPLRIGRVVDASGVTIARIVVDRVLDSGLVATILDGADRIHRGATVHFDPR